MRLQHYSATPLTLDRDRVYDQDHRTRNVTWDKPRGLWVSVAGPDDWPTWCRAEDFALHRLRHCADIELAAVHHVHVITTIEGLYDFTRRYRSTNPPLIADTAPGIDWERVARDHDGVIVTVLHDWRWGLDHPLSWLYGWDATSGCIWGLDAIATVTPQLQAVTA